MSELAIQIVKYYEAYRRNPDNPAWVEWIGAVFRARTGVNPPVIDYMNVGRLP